MNKPFLLKDIFSRFGSGTFIRSDAISSEGLYPVYGGNGQRGYTDTYNFEGECVVIGRQGAYCGNVKFFSGKGYFTEHAIVAVANNSHNIRYLFYKLGMMNLGRYAGQSAQPGLSVDTLMQIEITLPDKSEQDKIAFILSQIDDKIDNNNKIISELDSMARLIYDYWFVQFDFPDENGRPYKSSGGKMVWNKDLCNNIPVNWNVDSISKLINIVRGVNYKKSDILFYPDNNSVSLLKSNNIQNGMVNIEKPVFIPKILCNENQWLTKGSIFITMSSGSKKHMGKTAIIYNSLPYVFGAFCSKIEIDKGYTHFLSIYFTSKYFKKYINKMSIGTNINNIINEYITNIKTFLPQRHTLNNFENIIAPIFDRIGTLINENIYITNLRDYLLPLLMKGQVSFCNKNN